ncbi:hypothetical protein PIB30_072975 [Stylosanthes scabra]|uniref:Uncharacterized protein n=1 Tax=Stylosanthes scabra TaxID=79078 RepID=A0ABU6TRJ4_9FABA|nr:hypothetical protein [Stylosanthes scabra]
MASKGKAPVKALSTRAHGSTSQQQPPFEIQLYETPAHAERAKTLEERKVIHERTIKFPKGKHTFEERILARGWDFMAKKDQHEIFLRGKKMPCFVSTIEKVLNIPKFEGKCGYSEISVADNKNELNMDDVLKVIGKEGATWWEDPCTPVIPARPKNKIRNYEAWMWLKLIFFPYGKWREEEEEVAPPIPPPVAPADIPTPFAPSSPEPLRRDLMRVIRQNERIMRRHEQLMLMLHPRLDISGLEQISSPEISQNRQEQGARSAEREDAEEDEDF